MNFKQSSATEITDKILKLGYIHNNIGNFYKNYRNLAKRDEYGAYADLYWKNTKEMARNKIDSCHRIEQDIGNFNSLIADIDFSSAQKALKDFRYNSSEGYKEIAGEPNSVLFILEKRNNEISDQISSGLLDKKSLSILKQTQLELTNAISQIQSWISNKDSKFKDLGTDEVISKNQFGGILAELLAENAIKEWSQKVKDCISIKGTITINESLILDKEGKEDSKKIKNKFTNQDISLNVKNNEVTRRVGFQIKNTQKSRLYTKFNYNSFDWDENFNKFLPFLYYSINNINALNSFTDGKLTDPWDMLRELWKGILLRALIRGILVGAKDESNLDNEDNWNIYLVMLGPDSKNIFNRSSELISLAEKIIDSKGTLDGSEVNGSKNLAEYVKRIAGTYSEKEMENLCKRKIKLSKMLNQQELKENFYEYVVGIRTPIFKAGIDNKSDVIGWKMDVGGRYRFLEHAKSLSIIVPIDNLYK